MVGIKEIAGGDPVFSSLQMTNNTYPMPAQIIGTINEIKQGTFTLPKRISLLIDDNTVEIPAKITMVIGKEKPIIQVK